MSVITPLSVPWEISSDAASLSFGAKSCDGSVHGYVTFFGLVPDVDAPSAQEIVGRQIVVTLDRIVYAKLYVPSADDYIVGLKKHDWTQVPEFDGSSSFAEHREQYYSDWANSGICPDPCAYTIEGSELSSRYSQVRDRFSHFLFMSEDVIVEAVAIAEYSWQLT